MPIANAVSCKASESPTQNNGRSAPKRIESAISDMPPIMNTDADGASSVKRKRDTADGIEAVTASDITLKNPIPDVYFGKTRASSAVIFKAFDAASAVSTQRIKNAESTYARPLSNRARGICCASPVISSPHIFFV